MQGILCTIVLLVQDTSCSQTGWLKSVPNSQQSKGNQYEHIISHVCGHVQNTKLKCTRQWCAV